MNHLVKTKPFRYRVMNFCSLLAATVLLSGCGVLNVTHIVPTTGRVFDVGAAEPRPIPNAWVRLAWGHDTLCLNPVQPCSRPVCDKVEAVQTDSQGRFRVWGIPLQGLVHRLWLAEGSHTMGVMVPGYVNLYSVGTLEERFVAHRRWINEHGKEASEGHNEYIPKMESGYEQYAELYKRMTQRPGEQRNDIWVVPYRARTQDDESLAQFLNRSWHGHTGCAWSSPDVEPLREALRLLIAQNANREATKTLRVALAMAMLNRPFEPRGSTVATLEGEAKEWREIDELAEKL